MNKKHTSRDRRVFPETKRARGLEEQREAACRVERNTYCVHCELLCGKPCQTIIILMVNNNNKTFYRN